MPSHYLYFPSRTERGPLRPRDIQNAAIPCYLGSQYPKDDHPRPDTCDLCFDDMGAESLFRRIPCRHIFHKPCIDQWICTQDASCPLCRQTFYDLRGPYVVFDPVAAQMERDKDEMRESREIFVLWWKKLLHLV